MVISIAREKRRRLYAFVEGVVPQVPENNYSRETLMLDCIDAEAFDSSPAIALEDDESLSLVRVQSTRRRLQEDFGLPLVEEGQWLELVLAQERGAPRAWTLPAAAQFALEERTNVQSIAFLPETDAGSSAARLADLRKACALPDKKYGPRRADFLASLELSMGGNLEIRAVDVGQASCTVFLVDGKPIGYFDVGAPLWRNQKSFSGHLCHSIPTDGFVFLSHWDFDHFDLARRRPLLQRLSWLAPDQPVGPNTLKFQKRLGDKLRFLSGSVDATGFKLRPGLATSSRDRNGTGYSMRVGIDNDVIVLTGDCGYDKIDPAILDGATAITTPHHGGKSVATPPPAAGAGRAVASYGLPNCYRHPCEEFLDEHDRAGWDVQRTASHPSNGHRRGYRTVYP